MRHVGVRAEKEIFGWWVPVSLSQHHGFQLVTFNVCLRVPCFASTMGEIHVIARL